MISPSNTPMKGSDVLCRYTAVREEYFPEGEANSERKEGRVRESMRWKHRRSVGETGGKGENSR
jgi:hypothetical protein